MPEINVSVLENPAKSLEEISEHLAQVQKQLRYLLGGNIDADNIIAKSITAQLITVDELSAISANLGHITAGLIEAVTIIGSLIKTSLTFPNIELSSTINHLKASGSATTSVEIISDAATLGTPAVRFTNEVAQTTLYQFSNLFYIFSTDEVRISSPNIRLSGVTQIRNATPFGTLTLPAASSDDPSDLQDSINIVVAYLKAIGLFN